MCKVTGWPRRAAHSSLTRALAGQHVQRAIKGTLRVVLVGNRCAKDREHRVAHKLCDEAMETRDGLRERLEQRVLKHSHFFGIEPLGERSETAKVNEKDSGVATVRPGPKRIRLGDQGGHGR